MMRNPLKTAPTDDPAVRTPWTNASSRPFKRDITELPAEEALKVFEDLKPVTFEYKANPAKKHVGFIAEDVPALVATQDRKGLAAMDIVGVLTKVVQQQQEAFEEQQQLIKRQQDEITELERRIGRLEGSQH